MSIFIVRFLSGKCFNTPNINNVLVLLIFSCIFFTNILGCYDTPSDMDQQRSFSHNELKSVTKIKQIGKGGFGNVYLCKTQNSFEIAMKEVETKFHHRNLKAEKDALRTEIEILSKLKHENIVRYYGMQENNDSIRIFMEYATKGTIYQKIENEGALTEITISKYCRQILQGLAYLHEEKVVHRDLKCSNILLYVYDKCKLADFGLSKFSENIASMSGCDSYCGTYHWRSPESLKKNNRKYGKRSDIWSFGCTVWEMLTKDPPYKNLPFYQAQDEIVFKGFDPCFPSGTSDNCKEFVKGCFQKEPEMRPSAEKLLDSNFISIYI